MTDRLNGFRVKLDLDENKDGDYDKKLARTIETLEALRGIECAVLTKTDDLLVVLENRTRDDDAEHYKKIVAQVQHVVSVKNIVDDSIAHAEIDADREAFEALMGLVKTFRKTPENLEPDSASAAKVRARHRIADTIQEFALEMSSYDPTRQASRKVARAVHDALWAVKNR